MVELQIIVAVVMFILTLTFPYNMSINLRVEKS
jgi:hypothetical protein